jgi:hypothetical protein
VKRVSGGNQKIPSRPRIKAIGFYFDQVPFHKATGHSITAVNEKHADKTAVSRERGRALIAHGHG